jgi:hypothetical protein
MQSSSPPSGVEINSPADGYGGGVYCISSSHERKPLRNFVSSEISLSPSS